MEGNRYMEKKLFVPGRTELAGNHTDHQQGRILASAVDLGLYADFEKNGENAIHIHSEGYSDFTVRLNHTAVRTGEFGTPKSLVRGMIAAFRELGLDCGGFNAELFRFMDRALAAEDETPHIISCSRKASAYLREHSLAYEEFILSDVPDYEETHALCEHLKKLYTTGAVNRVRLIYQSYRNMLSQEPTDRQILPDPASHKTANPDGILYLPSPAAIGARLALTCLNNEVFAAALDNASGAQAATLMAMRSACDSATESAAKLETTINRRRQADVTASVIEIASGNLQQGE